PALILRRSSRRWWRCSMAWTRTGRCRPGRRSRSSAASARRNEIHLEEIKDALPVALHQHRLVEEVRLSGEGKEIDVLAPAGSEDGIEQEQRLGEMHVVVGGTVHQEQRPLQTLGKGKQPVRGIGIAMP